MGQCFSCCVNDATYGPDGDAYRAGSSMRSPGPQTEADRAARAAAGSAAAARQQKFDSSAVGKAVKKSVKASKERTYEARDATNLSDYTFAEQYLQNIHNHTMFCHPYHSCHAAACGHSASADLFDDMFDDVMTPILFSHHPSSCHMAEMNARRAMEARRREQAARELAARRQLAQRQEQARRAKQQLMLLKQHQRQKQHTKHIDVRIMRDGDEALTAAIRVKNGIPDGAKLTIDATGNKGLRVTMIQYRPVYQRVYDIWGNQRLVRSRVEQHALWSETITFNGDEALMVKDFQAKVSGSNAIIVRVPYTRQQEEKVDAKGEAETETTEQHAPVKPDLAEQHPATSDEEHIEVTAAPVPASPADTTDELSEESFEIPIESPRGREEADGSIEDCPLDEE